MVEKNATTQLPTVQKDNQLMHGSVQAFKDNINL